MNKTIDSITDPQESDPRNGHAEPISDRMWDLPSSPWVMRMTWSDLLFAHWPIEPESIASLLPKGLALDTRNGEAWVGVVPFLMSDVAPRGIPALPGLSRFLELNVRTYVTMNGKPGVWFFSLDAASRIAVRVARATFNLPYMDAVMSLKRNDTESIHYRSQRTHRKEPPALFDATYEPCGAPFRASPGTLEYWLSARFCLYSADKRGNLYRGEIDHPPWTLRQAKCDIAANSMGESLRLDLNASPHLLYAAPIKVRAWWATRCQV